MNRRTLLTGAAATVVAAATRSGFPTPALAQNKPIQIAYIDPLSGAFANVGEQGLKHYEYCSNIVNAAGGIGGRKLEIVPFDNKVNPKETLVQLEKAIDQGIRIIIQGNGSSVAGAIIEAVEKHNAREPGNPLLYLNYAAVDPAFTNDKCSFWHFRFDADSDMKMEAITDWMRPRSDIKRVYILGQDYSFGKAVEEAAVRMLAAKRPDIEIVGKELHPLGKVRDFTPYVSKMKAAGTQCVITGNWGTDMTLLIKASSDAGFNVPYLTYYGGGLGAPTAMGKSAVGLVKQVTEFHSNIDGMGLDDLIKDFKAKTSYDFYYLRVKTLVDMLTAAMKQAGPDDPRKIALALEGMTHKTALGEVTMRKENHQLVQPLFISTLAEGTKYDVENTGLGFKSDLRIEADKTSTPTTCKMQRPAA